MTNSPATIEESARVIAELARTGRTVRVAGGETASPVSGPHAPQIDATVSTLRLANVVDYAPADQVITVQAGMTLQRLSEELRPHGQRFVLDAPSPERATIGGVVGANSYGPRRARFGTAKDVMLGMTMVRPDGTIARGGGKVVKNVAGFDLPRLMIGSFGTLGMIASVTLRVHPLPETERSLRIDGCTAHGIRSVVRAMTEAQLEPAAALALLDGDAYALCVRFEGFSAGVDAQIAALAGIAHGLGAPAAEPLAQDAAALDARHERLRSSGALRVKLTAPPSQLETLHEDAIRPLREKLTAGDAAVYPTLGIAFVSGEPADAAQIAELVVAARKRVEGMRGTLAIGAAPAEVLAVADVWGTPPPSLELMRALKDRFDPQHRFSPGRFVGGL